VSWLWPIVVVLALLLGFTAWALWRAVSRLGALEELRGVRGVADGRRRDGDHIAGIDAAGRAEVGEDLHRRLRAPHAGLAEPARRDEALADAHRLGDLVRALPPPVARGEDDEAERVRPEVDDGEALAGVSHAR